MADSTSSYSLEKRQTVDLSQAVQHVESTLAGVLASIQRLNDDSQQAKEDIRATFGRQLTNLHSRETQLLRQVDVIYRARREVMQKQLAHCHQILGSLETSKKWTEEFQKYNCVVALDSNELEGMKKWGVLNPLNWSLDEDELNKAISNFGKVDMEGVLLLSNEEQSKCLPSRVEEYFEEDQQVLNKPLNTKVHIIDIKFPKLPNKEGASSSKMTEEKPDSGYGPYRKGTYSYKPCDVQTWLGCIQMEIAAEPMEDAGDSIPEMSNLSDTGSVDSKESDSIEIVSIANLCLKSGSDPAIGASCPLGPMNDVEIENLADKMSACLKPNRNSWLLVTDQEETPNIPVAKACRANAVCDSFDSCVCDTNCYETAKKNRKEKDNQKWLHPSSSGISNVHNNNNNTTNAMASPAIFPEIFFDGDKSKWLASYYASKSSSSSSSPTIPATASAVFSNPLLTSSDTNQWLLRRSPPNSLLLASQSVLPNHFADNDNSKWLRPASPPPAKRINLAPVFPERFWEGDKSKWLHPESPRGPAPAAAADLASSSSLKGAYSFSCGAGTGSNFVDISSTLKSHPDNNIWLAHNTTITEALDEIKLKTYLTKQMKY